MQMKGLEEIRAEFFGNDPRTNRQRMLDGDTYFADDPENARRAQRAVELADAYYEATVKGAPDALEYLRELVGSLGRGSLIKPPLFVDYGENLHLGNGVFVNFNLTALDVSPIHIGDSCQIGPNVQLLTPTHPLDPELRRAGLEGAKPIFLEENVWLGGGVIVCPGVTVGANSVIGAGAVVTRDIPAGVLAVGTPARVVRSIA